jgi:hypothetical protein
MNNENRKKYMKGFDKIKKEYETESKERSRAKLIDEIKKDDEKGCGCK